MPAELHFRKDPRGILLESYPPSPQEQSNIVPRPYVLNGRVHEAYSRQIMTFSTIFAVVLLAQLLLLYLYIEYDLADNPYDSTFLYSASLCALLACVSLSVRFYTQKQQYELINDFRESLPGLFFKVIIILLSPYQFLEGITVQMGSVNRGGTVEEIKLNHLLTIVAFFRAACFAGVLLPTSYYMHPRANRIRRLFGNTSEVVSALKCIFKDAPARTIAALFSLSAVIFTFGFRVSEAEVYKASSSGTVYSNMAWMTMVTMTTMGYGDYVPETVVGRGIGSLCAIWGALIVSVMVVVLTSAFSLDRKESQALRVIKKLNHQSDLRQVAGQVIRGTLWRLWINRKYRLNKHSRLDQRKLLSRFRIMRRAQKSMAESGDKLQFYNDFNRQIQGATTNVAVLSDNNLKLVNQLTQEYFFKQQLVKKNRNSKHDLPKIRIKQRRKN